MADEVADGLMAKGLKVGRIHGDLPPRERKKMMKQILDLEYQYIVATDLAPAELIFKASAMSSTMNFRLIWIFIFTAWEGRLVPVHQELLLPFMMIEMKML